MLGGLAAVAVCLSLVGAASPASATHVQDYPYDVTVTWQMSTVPPDLEPGTAYPNGPFLFPQTRLDGVPTPGCEPVAIQVDTYTIHNKKDAEYLAGLTKLDSPADDARLSPHAYYAEVLQDKSACVTTVDLPAKPDVVAPTCDADGSFTLPANTDSVKWTIAPDYAGPGTYTVSAHTTVGNVFPDGTRGPVDFTIVVLPKLTEGCETPTPTPTPTTSTPAPPTETTSTPPPTDKVTSPPATDKHEIAPPVATHKIVPAAHDTDLASTGSHTGLLLLVGFLLLVIGASLVIASRRRSH